MLHLGTSRSVAVQAALDRPSFQQTIPNDADLIGGYVKVFGDPKDQFKQ